MTTTEVSRNTLPSPGSDSPQYPQTPSRLRLSTMSILSAIGSRFFGKSQGGSRFPLEKSDSISIRSGKSIKSNKSCDSKRSTKSSKSKQEEQQQTQQQTQQQAQQQAQADEKPKPMPREIKPPHTRKKPEIQLENKYKLDRDFRRFRTKYNNGLGNIVRSWMNLIYCVLILRMNVVKLILQRIQECNPEDCELEEQIRFESKIIYNMIRKAQHYSQERSFFLWNQLEKLIVSRAIIRCALEEVHEKEGMLKDWKGAAAKLEQVKKEAEKLKAEADVLRRLKIKTDEQTRGKLAELEALEEAKDQELQHVLHQISEIKRKEVKLRGKILLNMKYYKNLKMKKENLIHIEKQLIHLKTEQLTVAREYTHRIKMLKCEIEEKNRLIKAEKDEKKRLKANLKGLGDQNLTGLIKDDD